MNYNLIVDEQALTELKKSVQYYNDVSTKISLKFKNAVKKEILLIAKNPLLFQERYKSVRITFVKGFPYGIHYVLRGSEIRVIRILHTSQFYMS